MAFLDFVRDYLGETAPERKNQEGKMNLDSLEQEIVSGSGISWAICKSAPWPRHITMPASQPLSFLQAGCPSCRPTNSVTKHWRHIWHIQHNYTKCWHHKFHDICSLDDSHTRRRANSAGFWVNTKHIFGTTNFQIILSMLSDAYICTQWKAVLVIILCCVVVKYFFVWGWPNSPLDLGNFGKQQFFYHWQISSFSCWGLWFSWL